MDSCPVCGDKLDGGKNCKRCGYRVPETLYGDVRDKLAYDGDIEGQSEDLKRAIKKHTNISLSFLENLDFNTATSEELSGAVSDVLSILTIPYILKKAGELSLSPEEKKIIDVVGRRLDEADQHFGHPVAEPETYVRMGNAEFHLERHENALKHYDKALLKNPNEKGGWFNKSKTLFALKRYDKALKCLNKLLEIDPQYEGAMELKTLIQQFADDAKKA